jgi:hypothetical protein
VSLPVFGCLAERCVLASEFLGPGKHPKRRKLLTLSISGAKSGVKRRLQPVVGPFEDWMGFRAILTDFYHLESRTAPGGFFTTRRGLLV